MGPLVQLHKGWPSVSHYVWKIPQLSCRSDNRTQAGSVYTHSELFSMVSEYNKCMTADLYYF